MHCLIACIHGFVFISLLSKVQFLGQLDEHTDQCQAGHCHYQPNIECDQGPAHAYTPTYTPTHTHIYGHMHTYTDICTHTQQEGKRKDKIMHWCKYKLANVRGACNLIGEWIDRLRGYLRMVMSMIYEVKLPTGPENCMIER